MTHSSARLLSHESLTNRQRVAANIKRGTAAFLFYCLLVKAVANVGEIMTKKDRYVVLNDQLRDLVQYQIYDINGKSVSPCMKSAKWPTFGYATNLVPVLVPFDLLKNEGLHGAVLESLILRQHHTDESYQ
ncbi:hypothetical protein DER46DRAFT_573330 [Fusarium sp. MPI-SDFR-AT-0072]|nr:hypothetical protein DER46DRAFT_573330 [Fusarium sp. MPI-SDFR-AT-0072]